MNPIPEYQIYQTVQAYAKLYPAFTKLITYEIPRKVRISGFELRGERVEHPTQPLSGQLWEESLRRTKTTISDIIICNGFDLFCTFTFDPRLVDRQDIKACKQKMSKWLKRQRETHGKFQYVIVPEFHKDGKSLHFHALFKNYKGKLTEANLKTNSSRQVFNISSYRSGFSTAVKIDQNIEKVGSYVKKYITKDMPLFPGKKRYWASHGLVRPVTVANPEIDPFTRTQFVQNYNKNGIALAVRAGTLPLPITKEAQWQTLLQNSTELLTQYSSSKKLQKVVTGIT